MIRFGKTSGGQSRFRCKGDGCGRTFCTSTGAPRGASDEFKEQVIAAYQERSSMRGIARTFKISRNTLAKWLREKGGNCPS